MRDQLMKIYLVNISNNIHKDTLITLRFEIDVYEIRV